MRTSLSLILLAGLSLAAICEKIRLPQIVGMIVAGILLGPFVSGSPRSCEKWR